jgi:hypothetical protein
VTGEPVLDPKDLCTRHVLHQPEQGSRCRQTAAAPLRHRLR